jgi:hypothetical protein
MWPNRGCSRVSLHVRLFIFVSLCTLCCGTYNSWAIKWALQGRFPHVFTHIACVIYKMVCCCLTTSYTESNTYHPVCIMWLPTYVSTRHLMHMACITYWPHLTPQHKIFLFAGLCLASTTTHTLLTSAYAHLFWLLLDNIISFRRAIMNPQWTPFTT